MPNFPATLIDMHTHLFNARYVPLKEVFISKGVPQSLAGLLARFVLALTGKSRDLDVEKGNFKTHDHAEVADGIVNNIADLAVDELTALAVGAVKATQAKGEGRDPRLMTQEAFARIDESELYQIVVEINRLYGDVGQDPEAETKALMEALRKGAAADDFTLSSNAKEVFSGFKGRIRKFIGSALKGVESGGDFLEFIWTMLLNEDHIVKRLKDNYGRHAGVDLMVHHMMDMDHPFGGKSSYPFYTTQLERMKSVEASAQGEILGFAAFDPTRCVNQGMSDSAIVEMLQLAMRFGKRGFKFYPPMGFKAAGNTEKPRIEHAIDLFFDYCVENRIPVFTHCTPEGFEQARGSGINSHPKYWRQALTKKPSRKDLILCFGHAGGGHREIVEDGVARKLHGWLANPAIPEQWTNDDNFARLVVDLCTEFPHVYCELSYFHEIIDSADDNRNLKTNLVREYQRTANAAAANGFPLEDKMMYGSDWHMPSMVNDVDEYLAFIVDIYNSEALAPFADKFFFKNAVRYLQLAQFIPAAKAQFGDVFAGRLQALVDKAA